MYGKQLRVASIGFNYRMTKPQYAVGLTQLRKIDDVIRLRQERMVRMNTLLLGAGDISKKRVLPALMAEPRSRVVAVCDLDAERAGGSDHR